MYPFTVWTAKNKCLWQQTTAIMLKPINQVLQSSYSTLGLSEADVPPVAPPDAVAPRLPGRSSAASGAAVVLSVTSESLSCWRYKQTCAQYSVSAQAYINNLTILIHCCDPPYMNEHVKHCSTTVHPFILASNSVTELHKQFSVSRNIPMTRASVSAILSQKGHGHMITENCL